MLGNDSSILILLAGLILAYDALTKVGWFALNFIKMKLCMLLLAILYLVNARTIQDSDNEKHRHRRRSRYPYYDYDRYNYDRIDYGRDDSINEIIHLLQEISSYIKRPAPPPPPPQIIYIPYPVPYSPCPKNISLPDRFPEMEDENMNWGIVTGDKGTNIESENDGSRPISLDPIEPTQPFPEMPPVEHGSSQAGMPTTTKAPALKSRICQAAILICCDYPEEEQRKQCFYQYKCFRTYSTGISCNKAVINKAFEEFTKAYGSR
ncbi:unnamed protein product, partial [Brenthis ino]